MESFFHRFKYHYGSESLVVSLYRRSTKLRLQGRRRFLSPSIHVSTERVGKSGFSHDASLHRWHGRKKKGRGAPSHPFISSNSPLWDHLEDGHNSDSEVPRQVPPGNINHEHHHLNLVHTAPTEEDVIEVPQSKESTSSSCRVKKHRNHSKQSHKKSRISMSSNDSSGKESDYFRMSDILKPSTPRYISAADYDYSIIPHSYEDIDRVMSLYYNTQCNNDYRNRGKHNLNVVTSLPSAAGNSSTTETITKVMSVGKFSTSLHHDSYHHDEYSTTAKQHDTTEKKQHDGTEKKQHDGTEKQHDGTEKQRGVTKQNGVSNATRRIIESETTHKLPPLGLSSRKLDVMEEDEEFNDFRSSLPSEQVSSRKQQKNEKRKIDDDKVENFAIFWDLDNCMATGKNARVVAINLQGIIQSVLDEEHLPTLFTAQDMVAAQTRRKDSTDKIKSHSDGNGEAKPPHLEIACNAYGNERTFTIGSRFRRSLAQEENERHFGLDKHDQIFQRRSDVVVSRENAYLDMENVIGREERRLELSKRCDT
eukprot:g2420.t1